MSPLHPYDAEAFAQLSRELLAEPEVEQTLQMIVDQAVAGIDACDYAGISLRHGRKVETPAMSDELVGRLDQAQYDLGEGPCIEAVFVDDLFMIEDMTRETRWPRWTPVAAELGVLSVLSVRLATPKEVVGGLNLYSKAVLAYDEDQVLTAQIYAVHASNAYAATHQSQSLTSALQTRHLIGVAQGLLMQRYELSQDQAFRFLARTSQDTNVKLRDVAGRVVDQATQNGKLP